MKQAGLGLVELMVAITLGMVITLGVTQILINSQKTFRVQQSLAGIQENARFAVDLLSHELRMAGNRGCNHTGQLHHHAAALMTMGSGISGYEHHTLPAPMLADYSNNPGPQDVIEDTDLIIVKSSMPYSTSIGSSDEHSIHLSQPYTDFQQGDALIISDCIDADIFIASNVSEEGVHHGGLSKHYGSDARLAALNYSAYYLGTDTQTGYRNLYRRFLTARRSHGQRRPSLSSEPLLEGVEDMQIEYGERLANGKIRYADADDVDMDKVQAVRIHLLLASLQDNLVDTPQTYELNGQQHSATDLRIYRAFSFTVALRGIAH